MGDSSCNQVDNTRATVLSSGNFKQTYCNTKCCTTASQGSAALLLWPGIGLKVIQDRVKSELTFIDRNQESLECGSIALVQWITAYVQAKLVLDIFVLELLVSTEHVSFGALGET